MPALIQSDAIPQVSFIMEDSEEGSSGNCEQRRSNVDESVIERNNFTTPFIAVREKIVLCLDISRDPNPTPYYKSDKTTVDAFDVLKKALKPFIFNKHTLNNEHEFAVMTVEPGGVKWVQDFCSDPQEVIHTIDNLETVDQSAVEFDLTSIFKELKGKIGPLPDAKADAVQIPPFVVRLFLIYNSSIIVPSLLRSDEHYKLLMSSSNFVWDLLYLHDPPSSEDNCQEIYDVLISVLKEGSHFHETSRKITKLYNTIMRFLAHPFQRVDEPYINEHDSATP